MSREVSREATFALSPITVYSIRPLAPRKPATTWPVLMPKPNDTSGPPFSRSDTIQFCISSAHWTAFRAWPFTSSGAPQSTMMLSPLYLFTLPS